MSQTIKQLVENVGIHVALNIIQSHVVYPRTDELKDTGVYESEYSKSLTEVCKQIEQSIELKAIDAVKDSLIILSMIEEFKDDVLLAQADMLVIYKGGFDILKLRNADEPNSGRSIYIEINGCRNELIRYIQTARGKTIPWLEIGTAIGVGIVVLLTVLGQKR
jgi:hypothetical protein